MIDALLAFALFTSSIVINFAAARHTCATIAGRRVAAANWGAIIYILSVGGWAIAFTHGLWLLSFELAGLYIGTLIGVRK